MNSRKSAYIAVKPNASDHPIANHQIPRFPLFQCSAFIHCGRFGFLTEPVFFRLIGAVGNRTYLPKCV